MSRKFESLPPGTRVSRLRTVGEAYKNSGDRDFRYLCVCDCGNSITVIGYNLGRTTRSCGCLRTDNMRKMRLSHGETGTRLYRIWSGMKRRCNNPTFPTYKYYGGKGVTVLPEWEDSFVHFREWAEKTGYTDSLTIERKDVTGNYTPSNCEWITQAEQTRNTTRTRYVTAWGETKSLSRWVMDARCTIKYTTLRNRIYAGWEVERAIALPNMC